MSVGGPLATRLAAVRARLDEAARAAGRDPASVQLVAVSKRHPASAIEMAWAAGQRHFGENYAQELRDKREGLSLEGLCWHYIGRVQSNKARYLGGCHRIHAIEAVRHAEKLVGRAPDGLDVLLYVDVAGEASKGGVAPEAVVDRAKALAAVPGVRVRGLMCLPPAVDDPEDAGPYFAQTQALLADVQAAGIEADELSMGMSHDAHVAVRYGATWVRVGTAIFGARPT